MGLERAYKKGNLSDVSTYGVSLGIAFTIGILIGFAVLPENQRAWLVLFMFAPMAVAFPIAWWINSRRSSNA